MICAAKSGGRGKTGPAGKALGPGSTIRTRIALIYGGVFVVLGGCLLTVVNLLSSAGTQNEAQEIAARVAPAQVSPRCPPRR